MGLLFFLGASRDLSGPWERSRIGEQFVEQQSPMQLLWKASAMSLIEYTSIRTEDGQTVRARASLVISASRRTDIPAFYADWFFARLAKGYLATLNPFNGTRSYVSFERTRFVVFWSKNPRPLVRYLPLLRERGIGCLVHYTLNDYEEDGLERVPNLDFRLETFRQLSSELGRDAVVWRFDPLLLTKTVSVETLLARIIALGDILKDWTKRLVFSFADIATYRKVRNNLARFGVAYREWSEEEMREFAKRLAELNRERSWNLELATCGEEVDLSAYGIGHGRCIDPELVVRLASGDKDLLRGMGQGPALPGITPPLLSAARKDRGQRPSCGCMQAVDVGEYNTCPHLCRYCYANTSEKSVLANFAHHREHPEAPMLVWKGE